MKYIVIYDKLFLVYTDNEGVFEKSKIAVSGAQADFQAMDKEVL